MAYMSIERERYEELVKTEAVATALLEDISARAKKYSGYSYQEVQMLRDIFNRESEKTMTLEEAMEDAG